MTEELVRVHTEGRTGVVTLNRPKALNALTHAMVGTIAAALDRWEHDPEVGAVVITGAGERGLCAGGDIRSIYEDARAGGKASAAFWRDEYRLNA
ncbi:enoyl-CoA hydratase/isomerase family protein, partial [Streptomyces sp. SID8455]|nr:enoyl-CoA hydratase/isomerase family protein [Streptomyces sp. SID8455]